MVELLLRFVADVVDAKEEYKEEEEYVSDKIVPGNREYKSWTEEEHVMHSFMVENLKSWKKSILFHLFIEELEFINNKLPLILNDSDYW